MHCVRTLGYQSFLMLLWAELRAAVLAGDLTRPRQVGLAILTTPLPPPYLPLFPIFVRHLLSSIAAQTVDQHIVSEFLSSLVANCLLVSINYEKSLPAGQPKPSPTPHAMAKSVAETFRSIDGMLGHTLMSTLVSFPSFNYYFVL
jgi:hypothetical protein